MIYAKALLTIVGALLPLYILSHPVPSIPPCLTEDSQGPCYWDATTRGNGKGMSFIVLENGEVVYE